MPSTATFPRNLDIYIPKHHGLNLVFAISCNPSHLIATAQPKFALGFNPDAGVSLSGAVPFSTSRYWSGLGGLAPRSDDSLHTCVFTPMDLAKATTHPTCSGYHPTPVPSEAAGSKTPKPTHLWDEVTSCGEAAMPARCPLALTKSELCVRQGGTVVGQQTACRFLHH